MRRLVLLPSLLAACATSSGPGSVAQGQPYPVLRVELKEPSPGDFDRRQAGLDVKRERELGGVLSRPDAPPGLASDVAPLKAEIDGLDRTMRARSAEVVARAVEVCAERSALRAPPLDPARQRWLAAHAGVPGAPPSYDCVVSDGRHADFTVYQRAERGDHYHQHDYLALGDGFVVELRKNPFARFGASGASTFELPERWQEGIAAGRFGYSERRSDGTSFTYEVLTRAALRFERRGALVDTLYVLEVRGGTFLGEPATTLAVYSEAAGDVLKRFQYVEPFPGKSDEIRYAQPRRILYLKSGRIEKVLEGDALSVLSDTLVGVMYGAPPRPAGAR